MIKVVIWGAGVHGGRILYHIGKENVVAIIDNNPDKIGSFFNDIKIIDFETYLKDYKGTIIIISSHEEEIVKILTEQKISYYLRMSECPEDFQSPNPRDILKRYIQTNANKTISYKILGMSIYSLLLLDWLKQVDCDAQIVLGKGFDEEFKEVLKRYYKDKVIEYIYQVDDNNKNNIICTVENDVSNFVADKYKNDVKNILRLSEEIDEYHNPAIAKYKGIHKGKRCFIVATGPSLRIEDLDLLKKNEEICISLSSIYYAFEKTEWRPDYYIATDRQWWTIDRSIIEYMQKGICFIADSNQDFCEAGVADNKKIYIYHLGKLFKESGNIPFTDDFTKTVYNTATVTYAAIELAVYLGCETIYLLGVDANGINDKYANYQYFTDKIKCNPICFSGEVRVSYNSAKKYCDEHGINIYNATRGGELEIFKRCSFDDLFK